VGGGMNPTEPPLAIHPGLRARFIAAGAKIEWKPAAVAASRPPERRPQIACLRDDEARVEEWGTEIEGGTMVDSGPLGALALVLAIDRRGPPSALGALHGGRDPAFPSGAIVAVWGTGSVPEDERPRLADVVDLARYALE